MSSPIHCPECGDMVCETGWGHEEGEYECHCGIEFEMYENDAGGLSAEILS